MRLLGIHWILEMQENSNLKLCVSEFILSPLIQSINVLSKVQNKKQIAKMKLKSVNL